MWEVFNICFLIILTVIVHEIKREECLNLEITEQCSMDSMTELFNHSVYPLLCWVLRGNLEKTKICPLKGSQDFSSDYTHTHTHTLAQGVKEE